MSTTTIRVDRDTHARLLEMSSTAGTSLLDTVRQAAEALHRQRFAEQVSGELADLRKDPARWASYLASADQTAVADGIR